MTNETMSLNEAEERLVTRKLPGFTISFAFEREAFRWLPDYIKVAGGDITMGHVFYWMGASIFVGKAASFISQQSFIMGREIGRMQGLAKGLKIVRDKIADIKNERQEQEQEVKHEVH